MATWTYRPQEVLEDTLDTSVWTNMSGPRSAYAGRATTQEAFVRTFRLRFVAVNSVNLDGMIQFFNARKASYEAFTWVSPVDSVSHLVRFGEPIVSETRPYLGSINTSVVFVVTSG